MGISKHSRYVQERRNGLLREFSQLKFGGSFRGKRYEHILARKEDVVRLLVDEKLQNPAVCKMLFGGKLKFQSFAHHVNSSQIMCLNYFGPLLLSHQDVLSDVLRSAGVVLKGNILFSENGKHSQFEYQPQTCGDRTNFDLYLCTDQDEEVFIEAKYTENGFGKPTKGSLKDSEWAFYERLCDNSLNLKGISRREFYRNFQVNRNVAHVADERRHCLFFIPKSSPSLKLPPLLNNMKNVSVLYIEDVADVIARSSCAEKVKAYYRKLHEMYFPQT